MAVRLAHLASYLLFSTGVFLQAVGVVVAIVGVVAAAFIGWSLCWFGVWTFAWGTAGWFISTIILMVIARIEVRKVLHWRNNLATSDPCFFAGPSSDDLDKFEIIDELAEAAKTSSASTPQTPSADPQPSWALRRREPRTPRLW